MCAPVVIPIDDTAPYLDALSHIAASVAVVTVRQGNAMHGVTVSSLVSVSLQPRLVLFSLRRDSSMLARIKEVRDIGITLLADDQSDIARLFAARDRPTIPNAMLAPSPAGIGVVRGGAVHFHVRLVATTNAGDHAVLICEVHSFESAAKKPLLYQARQYQRLAGAEHQA